ncbi:MAG: peptidylprolyl isomerase [Nannocystaceae bacterium]|nr:peptidylprolyl isomerase [Nannocystaceae bacterium]
MSRAEHASARAQGLLERAGDPRPAVAAAAIAALADVEDPRVSAVLREALLRADAGVLAAASGAIAARSADRDRRDGAAVAPLQRLLQTADPVAALEARLSAIEALGALARSAPAPAGAAAPPGEDLAAPPRLDARGDEGRVWLEHTVLPLASDPNDAIRRAAWSALAGHDALRERFAAAVPTSFPQAFAPAVHEAVAQREAVVGLRVHTALGPFVIAFADAPAPIAQGALVGLARAGYFDGLRFHRIVPGFVVQGGDPRGDGYGGPGWVMPCEWSELRYERGTVGIALAGKDTGGSQFFVTHTRQPHLDGRFTVVGRVVDGMDIVDRLLPHDPIVRVEPLEALP